MEAWLPEERIWMRLISYIETLFLCSNMCLFFVSDSLILRRKSLDSGWEDLCSDRFRLQHCYFQWFVLICPPPLSCCSSLSARCSSVRPIRTTRGCLVSSCSLQASRGTAEPSATSSSPTTTERRSSAVRLSVCYCPTLCLSDALSSSLLSDLRQCWLGKTDSLPLWDGETDFQTSIHWRSSISLHCDAAVFRWCCGGE